MDKVLQSYYSRLNKRLDIKKIKNKHYRIKVKEKLCIYDESRDYTLNLMRQISSCAIGVGLPVCLDLSDCPEITASALVLLFAEISRARLVKEVDEIVTVIFPTEPNLYTLLDSIGWIEAVNCSFRNQDRLMENDAIFQTASNPAQAMQALVLRLKNCGVELTSPEAKIFTRGVNEAVLNVLHHAYSHEDYPLGGIGRRWWQACYKSEDENKMVYIICDFGQGILNSLSKIDDETDGEHISRAMTVGVSCTGEVDRGKGSGDILQAADIREKSVVFVGSNNASYGKICKETPEIKRCTIPFLGTIIEWQIYLQGDK